MEEKERERAKSLLNSERPRSCLRHHDGVTLLLLLVCIGQHDLFGGQVALVVVGGRRRSRSTARCHCRAERHGRVY